MWNALDEEIKMCNTVQRQKKRLKNKMLNKYKRVTMYGTVNMNVDLFCLVS